MATYCLTIYTDRPVHEQFEADPSDVTVNTSGEGAKISANSDGTFYQTFVPSDVPYTLETVED